MNQEEKARHELLIWEGNWLMNLETSVSALPERKTRRWTWMGPKNKPQPQGTRCPLEHMQQQLMWGTHDPHTHPHSPWHRSPRLTPPTCLRHLKMTSRKSCKSAWKRPWHWNYSWNQSSPVITLLMHHHQYNPLSTHPPIHNVFVYLEISTTVPICHICNVIHYKYLKCRQM